MFIFAQILSFLAMIINMVAVQLKAKKQILLTIVVSNLLFVISYILLGALLYYLYLPLDNLKRNMLDY